MLIAPIFNFEIFFNQLKTVTQIKIVNKGLIAQRLIRKTLY